MLTPFFEVSQNDEFVIISAKIPNLKFNNKSLQLTVDGPLFIFYLSPYYLRLRFNQQLLNEEDQPDFDLESGKEIIKKQKTSYDVDNERLIMHVPKKTIGEHFTDLEYSHKLMSNAVEVKVPNNLNATADENDVQIKEVVGDQSASAEKQPQTQSQQSKPNKMIEEIDINDLSLTTDDIKKHIENFEKSTGEDFNWQFKQDFNNQKVTDVNVHYGFNNQYNQVIENSVLNGSNDINELTNPGLLSEDERITERRIKENYSFNEDIYVAQYLLAKYGDQENDYDYQLLNDSINWKNPIKSAYLKWAKEQQQSKTASAFPNVEYSKEIQKLMIELPKATKNYDIKDIRSVYYLIVSLIFAYNLNLRINQGEDNVDSAWLVGKILPQFAYLDNKFVSATQDAEINSENANDIVIKAPGLENNEIRQVSSSTFNSSGASSNTNNDKPDFNSLEELVITLVKRSLIYPLHRHFAIITKALEDTYYTLRYGWKKIIEVLFTVRELFRKHSSYYVYNIVWLNDLLNFVILNVDSQQISNGVLRYFSHEFHRLTKSLDKNDVVFEKLNMGDDDEDEEMQDSAASGDAKDGNGNRGGDNHEQEDIELLETTTLGQLEMIAEELYKDSQTNA